MPDRRRSQDENEPGQRSDGQGETLDDADGPSVTVGTDFSQVPAVQSTILEGSPDLRAFSDLRSTLLEPSLGGTAESLGSFDGKGNDVLTDEVGILEAEQPDAGAADLAG